MPQIDSVTFLSQLFWLLVCFFIFYSLVLINVVPLLAQILKVRAKKLSSDSKDLGNSGSESKGVLSKFDLILIEVSSLSRDFAIKTDKISQVWISLNLSNSFLNNINLGINSYLFINVKLRTKKQLLINIINGSQKTV